MSETERVKGRPSLYDPKYCQEIVEFFDVEHTIVNAENKIEGVDFPSIVGFARKIGVNKTTIYEWAKHHEAFSNALDECRHLMENILINNSLKNRYNAPFAQFLLKCNFGYQDKQVVEQNTTERRIVEVVRYEEDEQEQDDA